MSGERPVSPDTPARAQADFKRTEESLLARGFKVDLVTRVERGCAAHSYGEVRGFFRSDPCKWLARAYLAISKNSLGLVLVAISLVDMPSVVSAEKYKHLVDTAGTGNVRELSRDTGPYRNIRFNGRHYVSGIDGAAVWNAQAQPIKPTSASVIKQILGQL